MVVVRQQSVRYAITNLTERYPEPGKDGARRRLRRFREDLALWAAEGVTHVQLREKALPAGELFHLLATGRDVLRGVPAAVRPFLLLNGRADIAAAAAADGVHLPSRVGELMPAEVGRVFRSAGLGQPRVSCSCHTAAEAGVAHRAGAGLVLFGPVWEKRVGGEVVTAGHGLPALREACMAAGATPVVALGGLTLADEAACLATGAAGVAGIRLFAHA